MPENLELRLVGELSLRRTAQPRRCLRPSGDESERDKTLGAVRAVDEPGWDLPAPVPAAQRRPRGSGLRGRSIQGDSLRPVELGAELQLELPGVEPVLPVHGVTPFLSATLPINSSVLTGSSDHHHRGGMFERFTGEARRAIVLAQEEARLLQHNYIGTEHLLLGLLAEPDGIAAAAVERFGVNLTTARNDVTEIIGIGQQPLKGGHIPFTPRAKRCLELALREALQLGHDYIGPEHVLLGIVREGEGVAAQILIKYGGNPGAVRAVVTELVPPATVSRGPARSWLRRRADVSRPARLAPQPAIARELSTTPAADMSLAEAARLAGQSPVGSHHILLASLADANSAASRALTGLGVDLEHVREALLTADVAGSSDELPEEAGRRQMLVTVTDDHLTVDASDPAIVTLGRAALDALSARAAEPGQPAGDSEPGALDIIRGDDPLGASLSLVWQALHDSLEDIRSRAAAAGAARSAQPGQSDAAAS